jgi:hypothetical protein
MFFKQSEFQEWLDAQQRETGAPLAEPLVVAGAAKSTQWQREPVILMLKNLYPPHGLRPKGTSVQQATDRLNKTLEFRDRNVSPDTVDRAFKAIEAAHKK